MENNDKWIVQIRKGVFEVAILSLIKSEAMYGYEITSELNKIPLFQLPNGSIYPILRRITKNNWATTYWEDSHDGPKRKYYKITDEGMEILETRIHGYKTVYESLYSLQNRGRLK
ncbi:PadR family transcriptional regulator [Rossellomorea marisflavi]|uniref:PadR family transcriptional regulator n=1 Tax=Rossellomorea marisflavi TaxID=189381 RepID=UPI00345ACFE9